MPIIFILLFTVAIMILFIALTLLIEHNHNRKIIWFAKHYLPVIINNSFLENLTCINNNCVCVL